MARKFPSREAIESDLNNLKRRGYIEYARPAATKLAKGRRPKTWEQMNLENALMDLEVWPLFTGISEAFGSEIAIGLFEKAAQVCRDDDRRATKKRPLKQPPPRKRQGAHNSKKDRGFLEMWDESNPDSPWSLARRGLLPKGKGEFYKPLTKREFAALLASRFGGSTVERRRIATAETVLRKLKYLIAR